MYILAGKKRLEEVRSGELEELRNEGGAVRYGGGRTGLLTYLVNLCNRFEKRSTIWS